METKVFCIGFHKTGTTSMGQALSILGYKNCHGAGEMRKLWGNDAFYNMLVQKDFSSILNYAENYDSFNDNPWYFIYEELDKAFPESKFILTTRNENEWLKSANKYFGKSSSPIRKLIYGKSSIVGHQDLFLNTFTSHNQNVREYFSNRQNDLLIIDLDDSDKWTKLCTFLNKPIPALSFPHLNSTSINE